MLMYTVPLCGKCRQPAKDERHFEVLCFACEAELWCWLCEKCKEGEYCLVCDEVCATQIVVQQNVPRNFQLIMVGTNPKWNKE